MDRHDGGVGASAGREVAAGMEVAAGDIPMMTARDSQQVPDGSLYRLVVGKQGDMAASCAPTLAVSAVHGVACGSGAPVKKTASQQHPDRVVNTVGRASASCAQEMVAASVQSGVSHKVHSTVDIGGGGGANQGLALDDEMNAKGGTVDKTLVEGKLAEAIGKALPSKGGGEGSCFAWNRTKRKRNV